MAKEKPDAQPDFETALKELESLVEKLESGDLDLNQSLTHFQRGVQLSRECQRLLDRARQTVEELTDPDDEQSLHPLEPEE